MFEMAAFKILRFYTLRTNKEFGLSLEQLPGFASIIRFTFTKISTVNCFPDSG